MTIEIEIPLVKATNENLKEYGYLIDSFENSDIEIVTWPKQGWRDIEEGCEARHYCSGLRSEALY